jgi:hypothetical protein
MSKEPGAEILPMSIGNELDSEGVLRSDRAGKDEDSEGAVMVSDIKSSPLMNPAMPTLRKVLESRAKFKKKIKEWGWGYHAVPGDGWCLFHAAAITIGRVGQGQILMEEVIDHMIGNEATFKGFMEDDETLEAHIAKIRKIGWGGEPELAAISQLAGRPVEIWTPGEDGIPVIRKPYMPIEGSIKLAYYPGNHYNALSVDGNQKGPSLSEESKQRGKHSSPSDEEAPKTGAKKIPARAPLSTANGNKRVMSNDSKKGTGR